MRIFLVLFFICSTSLAGFLETCYKIYIAFLPVAESCITYKNKSNEVIISSWVKTIVIGRLVRKVHNWGEAKIINFKPIYFELFQREGGFERDHYYHFRNHGVEYSIIQHLFSFT